MSKGYILEFHRYKKVFTLRKAENVRVGDKVCFELASADYIVTEIEQTKIGMVRHQHKGGSNSYWPHELLYVESFDAK